MVGLMNQLTEPVKAEVVESVLEVGCGDGAFLRQLLTSAPNAKRVVGVDIIDPLTIVSQDLLDRPGTEWVTAYGHELPFPDDSFDLVCVAHVLHHLAPDYIEATLAEMKRVLKPGGEFMICEMFRDNQTDAQMSHVFFHHWTAEVDRFCGVHHYHTFAKTEIEGIVDSLGLKGCQVDEYNEERSPEEESQEISRILEKMEKSLELVKEYEDFERLKQEAQSIHVWILTHGLAAPTRLLASGRL